MAISSISTLKDKFLRPKNSAIGFVNQAAWKHRSPPRYLGYTKAQVLDFFMRSNARVCATIAASILPVFVYFGFRYTAGDRSGKKEKLKSIEEDLLSEGSYKNKS